MNPSHETPRNISLDRSDQIQEVLSINAEKYSFLIPYLSNLSPSYRDGLIEAIVFSNEIGEKLNISKEHREIVHLATLLSDIGKFGNNDFQPGSNQAMRWLYSFDTSLESHEKQIPLHTFLAENDTGTRPNLRTWLREKNIDVSTEKIQSNFQNLRHEVAFEQYATEYTIDYDTITLAEAWSLYHILSGETIWQNLKEKYPTIVKDIHIDIARLHHLKEGVHTGRAREKLFRENGADLHATLLCIMILADKIQALQSRTSMDDTHIRNALTITDIVRHNLDTITEKYESIKMDIVPLYLKRVSSERRKLIQHIVTKTGARVSSIWTWVGKERRQADRRDRGASIIIPGYPQRG